MQSAPEASYSRAISVYGKSGAISPFEGEIHTQEGLLKGPDTPPLSDKEIITMDWLCDNVDGEIPVSSELDDSIINTVKASGVKEKKG